MQKSLDELARFVNGSVIGDGSAIITDVTKIEDSSPGSITFFANPRYKKYLNTTAASAVVVSRTVSRSCTNLLQVDNPALAFRSIVMLFHPPETVSGHFIHSTAIIEDSALVTQPALVDAFVYIGHDTRIGKKTHIGAHVYVGNKVSIGDNVTIHPNATILDRCTIGNGVIVHSGAVVGSDGFGYAQERGEYLKIPQVGNVVIDDNAEIGANCTIDRASLGSTYIGKGCKIDNLVQIAHNVVVGENTAIAAQTGIAGSTKVGPGVTMAGQVGLAGHIEIGENVIIGAQSGVSKSIPPNSFYFGYPARDHRKTKKIEILLRKLPELYNRLKELEKKMGK